MQPPEHYPRLAEKLVAQRLNEFPVVMIEGPRQSGKTTLVKQFVAGNRKYLSCDKEAVLDSIDSDVDGFIASLGEHAIVDEIQLRRKITRAIKLEVDERPGMGRFLLTGSSSIRAQKRLGDSLAGRACLLQLWPLCQAEIMRAGGSYFLDYIFSNGTENAYPDLEPNDLARAIVDGGYPNLLQRDEGRQRSAWLRHYCDIIYEQDIPLISELRTDVSLRSLLTYMARCTCGKFSVNNLSRELGISHGTTSKLVRILAQLGIVSLLGNYNPKKGYAPEAKMHKLQFNDSGMLATILKATRNSMQPGALKTKQAGVLFECFVFSEIGKLCNACDEGHELYFWDYDKSEVDIVIHHNGMIIGVEVKWKPSVNPHDFASLHKLAKQADNMHRGIVIHAGTQFSTLRESKGRSAVTMQAIPAAWLWSKASSHQI